MEQSAAETVDATYGDYCIAQAAKAADQDIDYKMFMERSENWRHTFDAKTGFLRGKKSDGAWFEPFDPVTWGDPYVEGSAWQHRWDVPHNLEKLIEEMGGKEKAVAVLEEMLSMAPEFNVGVYGQEIHEMSEMAAVPFGQYAHGNQPVHHLLYIFAIAGRPDLTRHWTRKVMEELYNPDTFAGDEDTGSMSAWYILTAIGFYPICPGKPDYVLGQSFFPSMTVHLSSGKTLQIESVSSKGVADTVIFKSAASADFAIRALVAASESRRHHRFPIAATLHADSAAGLASLGCHPAALPVYTPKISQPDSLIEVQRLPRI